MEWEKDPGWQYLKLDRDKLLADQSRPFDSKVECWVPDKEEGYLHASIKSTKGDQVTVMTSKGNELTLKKELIQEMNPPKFSKCEDMSNLSFLNDASVLWNLRDRYASMLIYTYSGLFCVVINPYKRLPIYTESVARMFMGKRKNEMPPHLNAVSDNAYRNMLQDRENQSMLITGESGAGKTENTKKVISYFASVGAKQAEEMGLKAKTEEGGKKKATLEEQIVQTNPVLEAYGNAKTVRNNNSSRFGKFIRIHFSKDGRVAGCDIEHYLLEKSRVNRQAPGERCYHIFYQMMSGWNPDLKGKLLLDKDPGGYWFINQAELTINGIDDVEEHGLTDEAFDILNFDEEEKFNNYKVMSGLLHMGEMKFKQKSNKDDQAQPDGEEEAQKASQMYGIENHEEFLKALCTPRVKVGTEWVNKGQNLQQVHWVIGAMAKGIYNRVFNWLVAKCNKTLDAKEIPREYFIGVLDIAGFEIFDFNSFEQLWINFVNEKLQQFFNHHMFVLEQEEYQREGIHWEFIDFGLDLAACIELIEKPLGIISMLDEECIVPKATDLTLAQKLQDAHQGKHPSFEKPKPPKGKQAEAHFALKHYAGLVRYNVLNWLEKNKDPLSDTVISVMKKQTGNTLLSLLWQDFETMEEQAAKAKEGGGGGGKKRGKSASMMTVSMLYRQSLNNLMGMLNSTHPHFIRCLIPNEQKKSGMIEADLVLNQLTCNGVLEGIRICRKGFPNRLQHPDFIQRYSILAADAAKQQCDDPKKISEDMMAKLVSDGDLENENFRVGHTKVFFKAGILAKLEDLRDDKLGAIIKNLQAKIRYNLACIDAKRREEQLAGFTILQSNVRSWCVLRTWEWFKLFGKVKPMLQAGKEAEEMEKLNEKLKELEESLSKEEAQRKELEENLAKTTSERNELQMQLEGAKGNVEEEANKISSLEQAKKDAEKTIAELNDQLGEQESRGGDLQRAKKKVEAECDSVKKQMQDMEMTLRKSESDKQGKDHQVRSLQDEMQQQDENIAKLNKEKKHQEEVNRKLTEDLQAEEDKVNHLNKVKGKLEQQLDDIEDALEREKRVRQDADKSKRKVDGEVKVAMENIDELSRQKHDVEANLKKKEQELHAVSGRLEDEQSLVAKLQRQIKELQNRVSELEEELEAERSGRSKSDHAKSDLQRELEELSERLDEAGGATAAQIEVNKKREAELAKLRRDLEEANLNHENQLGALRKKHNDAVAEMGDQLDQLQKQKAKMDKDKAQLAREMEDLHAAVDAESKAKQNLDKLTKQLELQVAELQSKADEQNRQLQDFAALKQRLNNENSELGRSVEDLESQLSTLHRAKTQIQGQLEEAKRTADEEARERQSLQAQCRNFQHESEQMRDQLDEENEAKNEVLRQLSKSNAEIQQWKSKYESEGLVKIEEIEEVKRRQAQKIHELQEAFDAANAKIASLDKTRSRLVADLDDAQVDVERANTYASQLEKKQKGFDKVIDDWRKKCDDLSAELDASQRDSRNLATEVFKLKNANDEIGEQLEGLRRENKNLSQEIKDLTDQLGEGGRSVHEMQKMVRRLEIEKEELQQALDEAEAALEAEESKVLRAQVEVSQIRQEIEKRIHEKEEEFENTRKNHQRAIDSMQASLETEARGRAELLRVKKKLESDINELEIALDHANKANSDAQKNLKKYMDQIKDVQMALEEEQRNRDEAREQLLNSEKRVTLLQSEKEELAVTLDQVERARKAAEYDSAEAREANNELSAQNASLAGIKRKMDAELAALHADLDETLNELKTADENAKRSMSDAARLAEELRQEQEHSMHVERMRKGLEQQIKDMQARLDEAEAAALKGGKKIIAKLEQRIREIEGELDGEQRRNQDATKTVSKQDRRIRELTFQIDEDKKNSERLQELVEKLTNKVKVSKRQVEEAEELATVNLQKYRQIQHQLEDAEERADVAENSLSKMRAKNRSSASIGLSPSRSAIFHSPSRAGRSGILDFE